MLRAGLPLAFAEPFLGPAEVRGGASAPACWAFGTHRGRLPVDHDVNVARIVELSLPPPLILPKALKLVPALVLVRARATRSVVVQHCDHGCQSVPCDPS